MNVTFKRTAHLFDEEAIAPTGFEFYSMELDPAHIRSPVCIVWVRYRDPIPNPGPDLPSPSHFPPKDLP